MELISLSSSRRQNNNNNKNFKPFYSNELSLNPSYITEGKNINKEKSETLKKDSGRRRSSNITQSSTFFPSELPIREISAAEKNYNKTFEEIKTIKKPQRVTLKKALEIPNLWKIFVGKSLIRRIIWGTVFSFSFILFFYETLDRIKMLLDPPISASVKLVYEKEMTFPAVTVCPSYPFRASKLEQIGVDKYGCKNEGSYCSWNFPWSVSTHTELIFKSCIYKKKYLCNPGTEESGKWERRLTSLGRCFTYKPSEPIYTAGDSNALEIIVDPQLDDQIESSDFNGIKVYIHEILENPLTEIYGININHGSAVHFSLQAKEFVRVNDPKNPCISYAENPKYIQNICIEECIFTTTLKRTNSSCGAPFMKDFGIKICSNKVDIISFTKHFNKVISNGTIWNKCFASCPEQCIQKTYKAITTSLGFAHSSNDWINVTIYFTEMWLEKVIEQWDYNLEEFISDTGGSLNLFLGASLVTFIQIFDYILAWTWYRGKKILKKFNAKRNSTKVQETAVNIYL